MKTVDKANWSDPNNTLLLELITDQIALGNYNKGIMAREGYRQIMDRYYSTTKLRHDTKQISGRFRALKGMYQFIKDMHTDNGLGRDENGWPTATPQWWEDATKVHHCAIGLPFNV